MNKNKKRLSGALVSMLVLSGMNMDAMEKKSMQILEIINESEKTTLKFDVINLENFADKVKDVDIKVRNKFDLKLLRKIYEIVQRQIKDSGKAVVDLIDTKIILIPAYPRRKNIMDKFEDFMVLLKGKITRAPICGNEDSMNKKKCRTYFTWSNQEILSWIYTAITAGGTGEKNSLLKVLKYHGKWGQSSQTRASWNLYTLFSPVDFKEDTEESDLAQSYDDLIKYCDEALKELN